MTTQIEVRRPINRTLAVIDGGLSAAAAVQPIATALKPKLLDQVRQAIRTRHYSYMTEKAYVSWIKRFIFFHDKRHPADMGEPEMLDFFPVWRPIQRSALPPKPGVTCDFVSVPRSFAEQDRFR
jgi:hypothetical protein